MDNSILSILKRNYHIIEELSPYERGTFQKILACRTDPVPNMYLCCDHCKSSHPVLKSCKNRLCPICNGAASLKWLVKREKEILPVKYFLATFTIPKELRPVFLSNKKTCYNLLFKAVSKTLIECIKNNNRNFNGHAGFFTILHTWDQRLNYHPHIHVVIPGGCLSRDKTSWNSSHHNFLLPVKKLSLVFRKKLLLFLRKEQKCSTLFLPKGRSTLSTLLNDLKHVPWVVNVQTPDKNKKPEYMLRYLAKYVHKTAVHEKRIVTIKNGQVYLRYVDRKRHIPKTETIPEGLFIKRLALHILPKGFKRTRFYGFMANRCRASMLALCGMLLGFPLSEQEETDKSLLENTVFLFWKYFNIDIALCPECHTGHLSIKRVQQSLKGG